MAENERNDANTGEKDGKGKKKLRILLRAFGCQMNERDSEFITGIFIKKGFIKAKSPEEADIILFNTCSVRKHAEDRAISNMGAFLKKKKRNSKIYGIIGCSAQALKKDLFRRLPNLDLICGTGEIYRLPDLIKETRERKVLACNNIDSVFLELESRYREKDKTAYVSIMRGCNNFCSYCIVPYVRGRERSRSPKNIINEIKELVKSNLRTITLLGQNVNSYKADSCDFVELLKRTNGIRGIEKINFMTSHPKDATLELFEAMKDLKNVAKELHLPVQSGSDRILKLMNR